MNFKCFVCSELFSSDKMAIKHLKIIHFIKDNKEPIYCLKNNGCQYHSFTLRQVKVHMKSCIENEVWNYLSE